MKRKQTVKELENTKERIKMINSKNGITLIALVVTMIVPYDKMKKCCNM